MKCLATIAVMTAALAGGAVSTLARSETAALVQNPRVVIEYLEPRHPVYAYFIDPDDPRSEEEYKRNLKTYERFSTIMERLKQRHLLERFSLFLAPLKLPITLRLRTTQCNEVNAFYDPANSAIILCYEYIADIVDNAPTATTPEGITRAEAIIGQIVGGLLHEAGHAISNLLRLPVLGREEDTADQIAAYVMLQFGRDIARTLIKGKSFGWHQRRQTTSLYWGPHSTALQRRQTFLCLAYGSDPAGFEDFVKKHRWLPAPRAANCAAEYQRVQHAFRLTILPHLDLDLVEKIRKQPWLLPDDATSPL